MATTYTVYNKSAEYGSDDFEGFPLHANRDWRARIEAKKFATEKGWDNYGITFFRESDQCRGEIEA